MTRRSRVMHCAQIAAAMGDRWYTVGQLALQTGTATDTVRRLLADLVASGHVTRRIETVGEMLERSYDQPKQEGAARQLWVYRRLADAQHTPGAP